MSELRAELIRLGDADERLRDEWSELAGLCLEPNPFFEPIMMRAADLPGMPDVHLLIVRAGHDLRMLAPVSFSRSYRGVPVSTVSTWDHDYSYLGTPLLASDDAAAVLEEALRFLSQQRRFAMMVFEKMTSDGPVAKALGEALAVLGIRSTTMRRHTREAAIKDDDGHAEHGLGKSTLKSMRRRRRRLAQELGGELRSTDAAVDVDLDRAIDGFLRVEASGWKGEDGGAIACRDGHSQFFRAICWDFAAEGRLQLNRLGCADRAVAFLCSFVSQDRVFNFKTAYDDDFRQFSPGTMIEFEAFGEFADSPDLESIDSCMGATTANAHRLFVDDIALSTVLIPLRGVLSRGAVRSVPAAHSLGRSARQWRGALHERMKWKKPL